MSLAAAILASLTLSSAPASAWCGPYGCSFNAPNYDQVSPGYYGVESPYGYVPYSYNGDATGAAQPFASGKDLGGLLGLGLGAALGAAAEQQQQQADPPVCESQDGYRYYARLINGAWQC
jgi:hypothetical protein